MIRFREYYFFRIPVSRLAIGIVRSLARLLSVIVWMMVTFFAFCFVSAFLGHKHYGSVKWRRAAFGFLAKGLIEISGGRIRVEGKSPTRPFYLVSNHVSWLDIVVFQVVTGCVFVSKSDVANWPLFGPIARSTGALFIERERLKDLSGVNDQIAHALNRGEGVVVFVESTTSAGDVILPFKSALLESAATHGFDVSYASVHYQSHERWPPASRVIGWGDWTPFVLHMMRFLRLPNYCATVRFGEMTVTGTDRKELAKRLEAAVREIHQVLL